MENKRPILENNEVVVINKSKSTQDLIKSLNRLKLSYPNSAIIILPVDDSSAKEAVKNKTPSVLPAFIRSLRQLFSNIARAFQAFAHKRGESAAEEILILTQESVTKYLKDERFSVSLKWSEDKDEDLPAAPVLKPAEDKSGKKETRVFTRLFGGARIEYCGATKPLIKTPLLAYFFLHLNKKVHKEKLMEKFWPDSLPECAKNSLNGAICQMRKGLAAMGLGQDFIKYANSFYFINPDMILETDMNLFNDLWKKANTALREKSIAAAVQNYQNLTEL